MVALKLNRNCSQRPVVALSLLLIISLVEKCEAQSAYIVTLTPIVIVVSIILCFCCCVCCACICHAKQRRVNSSKYLQSAEISYSTHAPYQGADYPVSHTLQGYVPPSARVLYSAQDVNQHNPLQTSTTVAESEPVPLPEASLHDGDAPPGYDEAIRMTADTDIHEQQLQNEN